MYGEDGTLKEKDDLKQIFETAGVDLTKPMSFTCGGGIMATVGLSAAQKAGATGKTSLYDGSWAEYSQKSK